MKSARAATLLAATAAMLALAAPAAAAPKTETFRSKPITVAPYQVKQSDISFDVPHPAVDGAITAMEVDIVDASGRKIPISRLMLHHIVFSNMGEKLGDKQDRTCENITLLDSRTVFPAAVERFYAAGEERAKLFLPKGYGYPMKAKDRWGMTYMLMNHRARTDTAYIQWKVTYDTAPKKPVVPYWLDVRNCLADPVYDVPGGGRPGSSHVESATWTPPSSGRIVGAAGHVHGGAKRLTVARGRCALFSSRPTWGSARHPFYNVKPILHEPGPINMSGFTSETGVPVRRGERLRLDSVYDASGLHTRVMGIMLLFVAHDASARPAENCKRPADMKIWKTNKRGRSKAPRFEVPLTGLVGGRARQIDAPPGPRKRLRDGARIEVGDRFFGVPNALVKSGSKLAWDFDGSNELHNVTIASGPRGFSSKNLNRGTFRKKLRVPGTYKLFCALHPVEMTGTVKVLGKR